MNSGCLLTTSIYGEAILRKLKILPEFIIGGRNNLDIRYVASTVLIAETEKKLKELLQ